MMTPQQVIVDLVKSTVGDVPTVGGAEIIKAAQALMVNRKDWGTNALMVFCDSYLKIYHNINYDSAQNGENWVLQQITNFSPKVVFDVGANEGMWSFIASKIFPEAEIHSFELVPATYQKFSAHTANRPRIHGHNFGLSDENKTVEINVYDNSSEFSSLFAYPHGPSKRIPCEVRRADEYIRNQNIQHIDFLKIDTEGAEHLVLKGLGEYLSDDFIDIIQFEYGAMNLRTQFLLSNFYDLLYSRNFRLGKLYPAGVEFKDYQDMNEAFLGPNYIAVSGKHPEIIQKLTLC